MIFHDFTIHALGGLHGQRTYDTRDIEPQAVEVMRRMIRAGGGACRVQGLEHLSLRWTADPAYPGTALATWESHGLPLTTSVLLAADVALEHAHKALGAVQGMLDDMLAGSPVEARPDLLLITERPALVTLVLPGIGLHPDLPMIADMETCLGAAYFEGLHDDAP